MGRSTHVNDTNMNSSNKTVVITGASSGMGLALAEACLKRGFNVVGNVLTLERAKLPAPLPVKGLMCAARSRAAVRHVGSRTLYMGRRSSLIFRQCGRRLPEATHSERGRCAKLGSGLSLRSIALARFVEVERQLTVPTQRAYNQ
jgi:NAD(P)-dependent dehydrogenase (short-subunit alcohol dehydrogenase family)